MSLEITDDLIARQPAEAQAIIRLLLAKIEQLESKFRRTPDNSSLPPSSQHPHAKPQRAKKTTKRKRGGQHGHQKNQRALVPTAECDEVMSLSPDTCRRCGEELQGTDEDPLRHQVCELPKIKPLVTEYQQQRLTCSRCGESTCASLPAGVPWGQSGPRLIAFTVWDCRLRDFILAIARRPQLPGLFSSKQTPHRRVPRNAVGPTL